MKTNEIKAIADRFSNSCRIVAEYQRDGYVTTAKGSLKADGQMSVRQVHITELGARLTDAQKKELKMALRDMSVGYSFQDAYGIKLAALGQYAAHVASIEGVLAESTGTVAERTPAVEQAEPVAKRNGKGATVSA